MNRLWQRIQKATEGKKYVYKPLEQGVPFESGQHYIRIVISEMYLEKSFAWFKTWYPAVHIGIQLAFGDQPAVVITRVVKPPEDATQQGVLKNYHILELTPYNGGKVEVQGALMALQGEDYLGTAIEVLQDFSSLVAPPLGQALGVAEKVSNGLDSMLNVTNGQVRLPYHDAFVGKDMGTSELKQGYLALIRAEAGQARDQVIAERLSVDNGELYYDGGGGKKRFRNADYMLLRIEQTDKRDDYEHLGAIKEGLEAFYTALAIDDLDEAERAVRKAKRAIQLAIYRSPDIAKFDKTRAWENIKFGLEKQQEQFGLGARGVSRLGATALINTGPVSMDQAVNLGELRPEL
ncbi:MAG: hypothetical protein PVH11_00120 [Anaerolineae bacterium]|jgi:hypothetical protein